MLAPALAHAQASDIDAEARGAIRGSFISCAAAGILSEQAAVGEALRRRLDLPANASRQRIYDAICDLTAPHSPRVRKEGEHFILQAGELELRMRYDPQASHITAIDLAGSELLKPRVEMEKPQEVKPPEPAQEVKPPPQALEVPPAAPKPAPKAAAKREPSYVIRLPPPVVRTEP